MPGATERAVAGEILRVFVSPDGSRAGAVVRRGHAQAGVVDGRAGEAFDEIEPPVFSPDGRGWAYAARRAADGFMVAGPRTLGPYGDVGPPLLSDDGRLSFGARRGRRLPWARAHVRTGFER